jgi:hypothetical protein
MEEEFNDLDHDDLFVEPHISLIIEDILNKYEFIAGSELEFINNVWKIRIVKI